MLDLCEESYIRYISLQSCNFLPSNPVVSTGDKIISVGGKLGVPHWVVVALVAD